MSSRYRLVTVMMGQFAWCLVQPADVSEVITWSEKVERRTAVSGVVETVGDKLFSLYDRGFGAEVDRRGAAFRYALSLLQEARREDERVIESFERRCCRISNAIWSAA